MTECIIDGYCIECGNVKINGDLNLDKWGGYEEEGGWMLLCPYCFHEFQEKQKFIEKMTKRRTFIKKILAKIFSKTIKWLDDVSWCAGHDYKEKNDIWIKKDNFKKLKISIINEFKKRLHLYKGFSEEEIKHIEKILSEKCISCKHYYEYDNCLAFKGIIYESLVIQRRKGNYGCINYDCDKRFML